MKILKICHIIAQKRERGRRGYFTFSTTITDYGFEIVCHRCRLGHKHLAQPQPLPLLPYLLYRSLSLCMPLPLLPCLFSILHDDFEYQLPVIVVHHGWDFVIRVIQEADTDTFRQLQLQHEL